MSSKPTSSSISVIMTGARMHYAVPRLMHEAGLLHRFYTDAYIGNKPVLEWGLRHLPIVRNISAVRRWLGRKDTAIPGRLVASFDALTFRLNRSVRKELEPCRFIQALADGNKAFNDWVVRQGLGHPDTIYGFNRNSLEVFQAAREQGIRCVLEQCSAPRRSEIRIISRELERWPDWEDIATPPATSDPLVEREEAEWALADRLLVPSDAVLSRMTECGFESPDCAVVPYGIDVDTYQPCATADDCSQRSLRVLYVGRIGLMKGIPYLLEALKGINSPRLEVKLVGNVLLDKEKTRDYGRWVKFEGAVPRSQIQRYLHWADVAIMPSLSEGSSIFLLEAMASGLPVIATFASGSVVQNGVDGLVVQEADADALAEAIESLLVDRSLVGEFSRSVRAIRSKISLAAYGERLVREVTFPGSA